MYIRVEIYAEIEGNAISVADLLEELKNGHIYAIDEEEMTKKELLAEGIEVE